LGVVRATRGRGRDGAREQPRHGRGATLRTPRAAARRSGHRPRHAHWHSRGDGDERPRRRLPRPHRGSTRVNPRLALATSGRVLAQIRHDPRTVVLLLLVPGVLVGLLAWILVDTAAFDHYGPALL